MSSVLLVDDEPDFLLLGRMLLEKTGDFSVVTATSASMAIQLLQKEPFDIIVSDFRMPGMTGIELLRFVRTEYGDIPFILFTGRGNEGVVIEAINNGANFYIRKDGDITAIFSELSEKMREAVGKRQAAALTVESESRLRLFIEKNVEAVCIFDEDGRVIEWNGSSEHISGIPKERAMGSYIWDLLPVIALYEHRTEECRVSLEQGIRRSLITGHPVFQKPIVTKAVLPDGTLIHIRQVMFPFRTRKGFQFGLISQDITREVRITDALSESEEKFRRFASNARDMLLRISLPDRRHEYISPASVFLTGYTPEEFYADPDLIRRLIHPAWMEYLHREWSALLEKKPSPVYEYQIIDRSGKIRWFNQRNVLVTGKNGEPVAIEGIVTDITRQKEKERELRRSEERFRAVSQNAGSWIWEIDTEGVYTYSSPAVEAILGYRPDELVGKLCFYDLFDSSVRDELKASALEIFDSRMPLYDFVNLNRHKNGEPVILMTSGTPVYDEEGVFTGYCGVDEDITQRRRTEEAVRRANRQLNLLSSITRHDILNKISVLKGQIALIETDFMDPVIPEYLRRMKRATEQIQSQIAFTRLYQDLGSQDPRWIQLGAIMPFSFLPEGITMLCELDRYLIFADSMLEKVFFNLLDNSVRHGQNVTEIRVSARESGGCLVIVWEDNGIGIPDSDKEKIFERGFGKNTGFGMFLIREILALTDISIREIGIPGEGARFVMRVPEGLFHYPQDSDLI